MQNTFLYGLNMAPKDGICEGNLYIFTQPKIIIIVTKNLEFHGLIYHPTENILWGALVVCGEHLSQSH
jgi:hypothetical protein